MNAFQEQVKNLAQDRRLWLAAGGVALFFILMFVFSSKDQVKEVVKVDEKSMPKPVAGTVVKSRPAERSGIFMGEEVDRKAFVGRLEEQYQGALEKSRQMQAQIERLDKKFAELVRVQGTLSENLQGLTARVAAEPLKPATPVNDEGTTPQNYRLEVVNINPVAEPPAEGVFLPAGSFVRGTLLTGVYAPADQNNPLPVLVRLNEAFYGPNEARIPLEGAFVIGKAAGELNSERALIQAVTLSVVLPNGKEFQHQGNIGYVTDIQGELGIRGVVVRNTGAQMAASFMTGFLGGASEAVANGETTAVRSSSGRVSRDVTGSVGRYAAFQGLAQSAAQLSKYYADQLNAIVPAVRVSAGVEVYLIILEGVRINGLKINNSGHARYLD
ncbi:MAG: TraB/VirB10 family protein [Candidatus Omnitrophica bacterium]|nr:TraB/VirB10 family protein [Candidatus Omnitrophota bacterium]